MGNLDYISELYKKKQRFTRSYHPCKTPLFLDPTMLIEKVPSDYSEHGRFAVEVLRKSARKMALVEKDVAVCDALQHSVLQLSHASEFLAQMVPYDGFSVNNAVRNARDRLNQQRTLLIESLVNDDILTNKILTSIHSSFIERDRFDTCLRVTAPYLTTFNMERNLMTDTIVDRFREVWDNTHPGDALSFRRKCKSRSVLEEQGSSMKEILYNPSYNENVETDPSVLCWSVERSYMDLPGRMLNKSGVDSAHRMQHLYFSLNALHRLDLPPQDKRLPTQWAIWSSIIANGVTALTWLVNVFKEMLWASLDCLWEFIFYQLTVLDQRGENELVESVCILCEHVFYEELLT